MKKAINLQIYKHKGEDFSNGGISAKYNEILIEHPNGWIDFDEQNPPENLCKIVVRRLFGKEYLHAEPVKAPDGLPYMAGGCVVYTSDSRFRELSAYPLSLHDRIESQKLYDLLSR